MAYATIDNTAMFHSRNVNTQTHSRWIDDCIIERDEEQRTEPPHSIHQRIVNIGSESHPHYELRIDYSDGSTYSYAGGNYHG